MTDSPLISTDELAALLDDPALRIVDGSWHLDGRNALADFAHARLPGAVFFDLDAVSDHSTDLPHMLPTAAAFAEAVGGLGIAATDTIVIYDTVGLFSAARVWWTFRTMGATHVRVLDGGLPLWRAAGHSVETGAVAPAKPVTFIPGPVPDAVADVPTVMAALTGDAQVVDARPAARFLGQSPEPRPGLRSGHMPGALNLPMKSVLDDNGRLKRGKTLASAFHDVGIDLDRPIVTTCGSGVTAAVLSLALAELGTDSRLYDGSWAQWGSGTQTPVVTGA
ncbi:MAG: 3-mercaptopyruvate sulfurtransferase [Alphaproteobacteria bacterium]|nr:MAG: 3-mercaptopyruvate sulfurtransferase [Alphaproteobacteria bacterium]PZO37693.1 MAG: 3-mercaptopyruvate sulfurtransferase [Alphaproteobacteria bacterium]